MDRTEGTIEADIGNRKSATSTAREMGNEAHATARWTVYRRRPELPSVLPAVRPDPALDSRDRRHDPGGRCLGCARASGGNAWGGLRGIRSNLAHGGPTGRSGHDR